MLGIKVKIMLPHDPKGNIGPRNPLPDSIQIKDPPEQQAPIMQPYSEHREVQPQIVTQMQPVSAY